MTVLNLPNILTMIRLVLIPVFITAIIYLRYDLALYLFAFAALTDKLDGFIAKRWNLRTPLGSFLDPLADKATLVTSFILFALYGWIPKWLTVTIISRDVIVTTGWFLLYLTTHNAKVEPSRAGKAAIASQFTLLCLILLERNGIRLLLPLHVPLIWFTAVATIVSGVQYISRGLTVAGGR